MTIHPDPKQKAIRLNGKAYHALRMDAHTRAQGRCEVCGTWTPLEDDDGRFDVFTCGHIAHTKSRGAGGSDILSNVKWKCYSCHIGKEHTKGETKHGIHTGGSNGNRRNGEGSK